MKDKSDIRTCFNCRHKIGGGHCPRSRRKEAGIRTKILKALRRAGENFEPNRSEGVVKGIVDDLTGKKVKIVLGIGEAVHVKLTGEGIRDRIRGGMNVLGPYKEGPCENWERLEPYSVEEMKEIRERTGVEYRFVGRPVEEVAQYHEERPGGATRGSSRASKSFGKGG